MIRTSMIAFAALAAAACTPNFGDAARQLDTICATEPVVHAAFLSLAPLVKPSTAQLRAELTAHKAIVEVCTPPRPTDIASALSTALRAYAVVIEARNSAADARRR